MTDKKVEPMTLNGFEGLLLEENYKPLDVPDDEWNEEYDSGYHDGLSKAFEIFQANRPRLEAGMRGVLRFIHIAGEGWWLLKHGAAPNDTVMPYVNTGDALTCRGACTQYAQSLGMTAEFVEEEE